MDVPPKVKTPVMGSPVDGGWKYTETTSDVIYPWENKLSVTVNRDERHMIKKETHMY